MKKLMWTIPLIIFIVSFLFRITGILGDHPFWVDEFSTANQANYYVRYGLGAIGNPNINFEGNNYTYHMLVAIMFKTFGENEFAARLPAVFFGALVPVALYFLARKFFNERTALTASILTALSYFTIAWSAQARSYTLLQLVTLLIIYFYSQLLDKKPKKRSLIFLIVCIFIGFYTHFQIVILLGALAVHYCLFRLSPRLTVIRKQPIIQAAFVLGAALFFLYMSRAGTPSPTGTNNLWYYHSFMWREYGLVTFISILGLLAALITRPKYATLVGIYIAVHTVFFSFMFAPYVSRYLLPIFPLIFMMFAYAITYSVDLIVDTHKIRAGKWFNKNNLKTIVPILLILFIIGNGHKFVYKPKPYYSLNHDFREIANIDYDQVYGLIKQKGKLTEGKTAVIDTWHDRMYWYMGDDYKPLYIFRWIDEQGRINGLEKKSDVVLNAAGERLLGRTNLRLIAKVTELKKAMKTYPRGFIFIDDSSMPREVIDYVEKTMKKELFLEQYPLEDNPYSKWPATLYSWGV